jgi:hypothetical protein
MLSDIQGPVDDDKHNTAKCNLDSDFGSARLPFSANVCSLSPSAPDCRRSSGDRPAHHRVALQRCCLG